jgi:DNA-binding response OmpR family regulator
VMNNETVNILLIEDNKDFAKLLQVYLQRYERDKFKIFWKENYSDAMQEIESGTSFDVILMDYFLPGKNGLEITKELKEKGNNVPVIFLTVNKDFDVVLNVMKLGVADYLVKEEIASPVLPKTILNVIEQQKLKNQLLQIEVSEHRLKAMRELLDNVVAELERPILSMKTVLNQLHETFTDEARAKYLKIVQDNIARVTDKLDRLKKLNKDKTVQYIKDIKMIDLS